MSDRVWLVWTEQGEYEQYSRDLRGVFATKALADAHAEQVRDQRERDGAEVEEWEVMQELPHPVTHYFRSGYVDAAGVLHRNSWGPYKDWSNECPPVATRPFQKYHGRRSNLPDLAVSVEGSDLAEVERVFAERAAEAKALIAATLSPVEEDA